LMNEINKVWYTQHEKETMLPFKLELFKRR